LIPAGRLTQTISVLKAVHAHQRSEHIVDRLVVVAYADRVVDRQAVLTVERNPPSGLA